MIVKHDGGACPVEPSTRVRVWNCFAEVGVNTADHFVWEWAQLDEPGRIVEYEVLE